MFKKGVVKVIGVLSLKLYNCKFFELVMDSYNNLVIIDLNFVM